MELYVLKRKENWITKVFKQTTISRVQQMEDSVSGNHIVTFKDLLKGNHSFEDRSCDKAIQFTCTMTTINLLNAKRVFGMQTMLHCL
jgi:hypothetical protein